LNNTAIYTYKMKVFLIKICQVKHFSNYFKFSATCDALETTWAWLEQKTICLGMQILFFSFKLINGTLHEGNTMRLFQKAGERGDVDKGSRALYECKKRESNFFK